MTRAKAKHAERHVGLTPTHPSRRTSSLTCLFQQITVVMILVILPVILMTLTKKKKKILIICIIVNTDVHMCRVNSLTPKHFDRPIMNSSRHQ